jgi:hypothetical protein
MRITTCAIETAGARQRASKTVNAIFFTVNRSLLDLSFYRNGAIVPGLIVPTRSRKISCEKKNISDLSPPRNLLAMAR